MSYFTRRKYTTYWFMETATFAVSEKISQKYIYNATYKRQAERLPDMDKQAQERMERLIEQMKQVQVITETAEVRKWIQRINDIRACAKESIVISIVYLKGIVLKSLPPIDFSVILIIINHMM